MPDMKDGTVIIRGVIMKHVTSSNLAMVGWKDYTLIVMFHSGRVYVYRNVGPEIYEGLIRAESVGGAFHRYIYDQGWEYEEITDDLTNPHDV